MHKTIHLFPELLDALLSSDLLAGAGPAMRADVLAAVELYELPMGVSLFRQGERDDSLFVVLSGQLDVLYSRPDGERQQLSRHGPGAMIGEVALLTGAPRSANAVAIAPCVLAQLSVAAYADLAVAHPQLPAQLARIALQRLRRSQLADALVGLFGSLDTAAFAELEAELRWQGLERGELLYREGEPADDMAILLNGRLRALVGDPGQERVLGELSRGQCVGEMALLSHEPRSASVVAVRRSDIVRLSRAAFERLVVRHPGAMLRISQIVVARLRRMNSAAPAVAPTVELALLATPGVDAGIGQQIAAAMAAYGPSLHLSAAALDATLGRPGLSQVADDHPGATVLNVWINEQAREHAAVIYSADNGLTQWTRRALRQADTLLLVGRADQPPALGISENALLHLGAGIRRELLLVHPGPVKTGAVSTWRAALPAISRVHHLRADSPGDVSRLARRIGGRASGLVLGGGGARGLAHIGVVRALEERGIDIDLVGGTSSGALVAALYAMGLGWRDMLDLARSFARRNRRPDLTWPAVALMSGRVLTGALREVFGELAIEDLPRGFFCVSGSLSRVTPVIHREGSLWRAVRASCALPVIFPPALENEEVLVDGAVVNNLPVDVMRAETPAGRLIAVNVTAEVSMGRPYRFGPSISGWQVLLNRLRPSSKRTLAPSIIDMLMRVLEFNAVASLREHGRHADLMIRPAVKGYGSLDFSAWETIVAAGYSAAMAQLEGFHL